MKLFGAWEKGSLHMAAIPPGIWAETFMFTKRPGRFRNEAGSRSGNETRIFTLFLSIFHSFESH